MNEHQKLIAMLQEHSDPTVRAAAELIGKVVNMTELDESFPRYRMLLYLANPLADLRVPLAAVVRLAGSDIHVIPRFPLPDAHCLGSAIAAAHVQMVAPYLMRIDSLDQLPAFLGPHFVLGGLHSIPTVDGWCEWLEKAISPTSELLK